MTVVMLEEIREGELHDSLWVDGEALCVEPLPRGYYVRFDNEFAVLMHEEHQSGETFYRELIRYHPDTMLDKIMEDTRRLAGHL